MQTSVVGQEVTMIQAIAECYEFNPRKKKGSVICFEVFHGGYLLPGAPKRRKTLYIQYLCPQRCTKMYDIFSTAGQI